MRNRLIHSRWFRAAVALSLISLAGEMASATGEVNTAPAADARSQLVTVLAAIGPHRSLGDHARVFDRLVGTWGVEYTDFSKDGEVTHRTGQLTFGWILDGRALQDLWIVDPSGGGSEREVYSDVFYFDPKSQTWHVASVDPLDGSVATFTGGSAGEDQIVLDSHDLVPNETRRWSLNQIRADSLVFRDEASSDEGKTWKLKSEYHMKRRAEPAK